MINLRDTLGKVQQIAREVGAMQKDNLGRSDLMIDTKTTGIDLVTEIDKKSEQAIISFIRNHFPDHNILAEESGLAESNSDYLWIIDPLDGTTNYSQGLPVFAVSIALQHCGQTVLGVVYLPVIDQMFTAIRGEGAYLNGIKLEVSRKTKLIDCVLATGFPYDIADNSANNIDYFSEIVVKARAVRRIGAAAYDIACVAAGKFDGYWEMKLCPWDAAAAVLMVEEAGGKVIEFRKDRGISIVAGNEMVCEQLLNEIKEVDKRSC